ncbi:hypothetical protein MATL_G00131320 [Megalops atlanticus]|uniref:Uncharacterized protein n=1 Tax=Megalops atlanticus TaxID=7932 RepID=A0A9D3PVK4_MEGAT|nr:hypothetical protein MATL_G00131320 [Megalops atlanticus]
MQWFTLIAAFRELGGRAARTPLACPWKLNTTKQFGSRPFVYHHTCCLHTEEAGAIKLKLHNLRKQNVFLVGQKTRQYSTGSDKESNTRSRPGITVVGIPDPISWIRNKCVLFLIELYFGLSVSSVEFDNGAKQAVVYISNLMSLGKFEELRSVVSNEALDHAKTGYKGLTQSQRRNLAIGLDDIIFQIPEDVSLFFDSRGRKFCYILMRFWHLSSADLPEDPESTRIFKVTETEGEDPPKKIVTAVYEFHRELTDGAEPEWTVTSIWHWKHLE